MPVPGTTIAYGVPMAKRLVVNADDLGYDPDGHLTSVGNPTASWSYGYNRAK